MSTTEIKMDISQSLQGLRQRLADLDYDTINRLMVIQDSKTLLVKKRGLSNDLENVLGWSSQESERLKSEWLDAMNKEHGIDTVIEFLEEQTLSDESH